MHPWGEMGNEGPCAGVRRARPTARAGGTTHPRRCVLGRAETLRLSWPAACPRDVRPAGPHGLLSPDPAGSPTGQCLPKAAAPRPRHRAPRRPQRPRCPQVPGFQNPNHRQHSQASSKLQHFIAASAKVRFLKLVKFGQHFHVKWYNFTSLVSYLILHAETETW